ncbi:MAG: Glucose-repressible protein [Stictis urceolatum]|nr:Glucose-repressible protein [Stictis urceolata]
MSAPNADKPNEGLVGQAVNSVANAVNYATETIQGKGSEASKEANKEKAKGHVAGADSLTDRVSGASDALGDKLDQHKHETAAEANKRSV